MNEDTTAPPSPRHPVISVTLAALRDWYDDFIGILVLNFLWMLSWMTIILGPPFTFGMGQYAHAMAYGRNEGFSAILEGARRYVIKSWLAFTIFLLGLLILGVNIAFYWRMNQVWAAALSGLFALMLILWVMTHFYALAYFFELSEPSWKTALKNGLFTILAAPGYSFLVAGLGVGLLSLSMTFIIPLFFGIPVFTTLLAARSVRERIETYRLRDQTPTSS